MWCILPQIKIILYCKIKNYICINLFIMKKHSQIKNEVTLVLIKDAKTRDCDVSLYSEILKKYGKLYISAGDLMHQVKSGELPSYDRVSRVRRLVQVENPSLRGLEWSKRHHERQTKVRQDLGYAS